jgi:DhnA family fructose-bisphosphate aldolase class Ia
MRTDVANCYGKSLPAALFSELIDEPVQQALALDAACVVVNLLLLPDEPDLHRQCIANICRLVPVCRRFGMPLMVEPLVMQPEEIFTDEQAGGYMVDGTLEKIVPLVRQAVELGADVIKADPCGDLEDYHEVVQAASPRPVLVRGGGRVSDDEILKRTEKVMKQGAAGIVYGRSVIQHPNPAAMTQALMSIVHKGATAEQARTMLAG